jgi:GH15 family glucan-1,4-alpha-glucosidase
VRDSTFALWGLYTLGLDREADDFFAFIADVSAPTTVSGIPAGDVRRRRRTQPRE